MSTSPFPTQTPLNLILPIKKGSAPALKALLTGVSARPDKPVEQALTALGNVHHAQFVFLEDDTRLGVLTWYDGPFDDYILSFVEHIGFIFDQILSFIEGGQVLIPVREHREAFLSFIRTHDSVGQGVFCAYPGSRAFDIRDAMEKAR